MADTPSGDRTAEPERTSKPVRPRRLLVWLGLALAALGAIVLVGGLALDTLGDRGGIAAQIVAFPVATGALVIGLLLALAGWVLGATSTLGATRSDSSGSELPRRGRVAVLGLSVGALAVAGLLGFGATRSLAVMDSPEFCTSCHSAMLAEETAYAASPHARVACADCHIGPGVGWFIRSKWIGFQELVAYTSGKWVQPIPVPVANLRPAQDTCERCHWPTKLTADRLVVRPHFASDEGNNAVANVLVVHTGGGAAGSVGAGGIHFDMLTRYEVRYFATDPERQQIPWVEAIGSDGKATVYRDTAVTPPPSPSPDQIRRLDCIDCHNRPTHIFPTPDQALDTALDTGAIDRTLPFVKREALAALGQTYPDTPTALQQIGARLRDFYQQSNPDLAATRRDAIDRAVSAVQAIYARSFFPATRVDWQTYPDNLGHQRAPGCFRCHDGKHLDDAGRAIPSACDTCHTVPQTLPLESGTSLMLQASLVEKAGPAAPTIPHALDGRADCLRCHATGTSGARAEPADHKGRTDDTCQSCHKVDAAAASAPAAKAIPHSIAGFTACLNCHASGPQAVPADHAGRTNAVCQSCHTPSGSTTAPSLTNAAKIPHVLTGNADCLRCHTTGAQAVPPDHAGRANGTCQTCHQSDTSVAAIPHVVAGFAQCLGCHAQGQHAVPLPSHAGRTNDTCQFCHAPNPSASAVPLQAGANTPHLILGRDACLSCHASGDHAVPTSHAGRADNTCQTCHQQDPSAANAAQITHTVDRFGDCLGCHAAGAQVMPADHAGRQNPICLECHGQSPTARPLRAGEPMPHPASIPPCLNCHRVGGGEEGLPASHAGRTSGVCRLCH